MTAYEYIMSFTKEELKHELNLVLEKEDISTLRDICFQYFCPSDFEFKNTDECMCIPFDSCNDCWGNIDNDHYSSLLI